MIVLKASLVGDGGVGKTTLIKAFKGREKILGEVQVTVGFNIFATKVNEKTTLQVWDMSGQDIFTPLIPELLQGSLIIIFVFDLNRPSTLVNIHRWMNMAKQYVKRAFVFLVGNKKDLPKTVDDELISQVIEELKKPPFIFLGYFETSALTGEGVIELFNHVFSLAETIASRIKK